MLEANSVAEAFAVCGFDVTAMSAVILRGGTEVPTVNRVKSPGATVVSFLVDLYLAAKGSKGHLVVVEGSVEMRVCRDGWGGIGLT